MARKLTPDMVNLIAERFRALGEPARLQILVALRECELTGSELVDETGLGQANVSKHLQMLHAMGFVTRRKDGLFIHYGLADPGVFMLCDIMCGRIESQATARRKVIARRG